MDVSSTSIAPGKSATLTIRVEPEVAQGLVEKTVTIASNDPSRPLQVVRLRAEVEPDFHATSSLDKRQSIFSAQCRSCHADGLEGKSGMNLYKAACASCHGSLEERENVRALDVKKLGADLEQVRRSVALGHDSIPGFSQASGGPLAAAQVNSLVDLFRPPASRPVKTRPPSPARKAP
jgi:hypothetical protein